jgi:hypothetical protein
MIGASLQVNSTWAPTLRFMASCLAHMGRHEEAQEMVKRSERLPLLWSRPPPTTGEYGRTENTIWGVTLSSWPDGITSKT